MTFFSIFSRLAESSLFLLSSLLEYHIPTPIIYFWCQNELIVMTFLLTRVNSSCSILDLQFPIVTCLLPLSVLILHSTPTILFLKKNFILSRYFTLISVCLISIGAIGFFDWLMGCPMGSSFTCLWSLPSKFLYTHWKVIFYLPSLP